MDKTSDRRSFLKAGALAAAPIACVAAPAAALADDGSRARLARLEDEREIDALHRAWLRSDQAKALEPDLRSIAASPLEDGTTNIEGNRATLRRPVTVELETEFTGHSTIEKMARFQGQGGHRREESRMLAADFEKGKHGWRIARVKLA